MKIRNVIFFILALMLLLCPRVSVPCYAMFIVVLAFLVQKMPVNPLAGKSFKEELYWQKRAIEFESPD